MVGAVLLLLRGLLQRMSLRMMWLLMRARSTTQKVYLRDNKQQCCQSACATNAEIDQRCMCVAAKLMVHFYV